jgi:leucyl/phenylalanyl-tRNA--protein transferase
MTQLQQPFWIDPNDPDERFPDVALALQDPDGLLAVGGDLGSARILDAYRHGIFPWYSEEQPILWWSPDPRTVLIPDQLKVSRSLRKTLNRRHFRFTLDQAFEPVIDACAEPRAQSFGTWITREMRDAYCRLHREGWAHSVEVWEDGQLAGGLYGLAIGRVYFGESMFSRVSDASKAGFSQLVRQLAAWGFELIDCQVYSSHLASLGAAEIPRRDFVQRLEILCRGEQHTDWRFDSELLNRPW